MWPFRKRQRHEFDFARPLKGETGLYIRRRGKYRQILTTGYRCVHCNKILWIDRETLESGLHKSMAYCDKKQQPEEDNAD